MRFVRFVRSRTQQKTARVDHDAANNRCLIARVFGVIPVVALALASAQAGTITTVASTIPSNGDLNPYGVARVPTTTGR